MATATQPFTQPYATDPIHSSFGFAVRHNGASTFRGTLEDATATVTPADAGPVLEGEALVESISIRQPDQFRGHVLGEEFFDAAKHPKVTFRSEDVELADDGTAVVRGQLTLRGVTRDVVAQGTWTAPFEDPFGHQRAALELEADLDRTDYGITWNMALPNGGNILDEQVKLIVHLELVAA